MNAIIQNQNEVDVTYQGVIIKEMQGHMIKDEVILDSQWLDPEEHSFKLIVDLTTARFNYLSKIYTRDVAERLTRELVEEITKGLLGG